MDARLFQHAIRSATVTYPIPFVFSMLVLFAVACFSGTLLAADWLRILFAVSGVTSMGSAIGLVAYAMIRRPEMLRSERHVLHMTMAQMIGDKEMDPVLRDRLSHAVLDADDRPRPKSPQVRVPRQRRADEDR